jgi:DNA modification methylase
LIIIDPPYNVSRNRVLSKGKDKKPYSLNFFENDNNSEQDYKNWFQQFVIHFHRI